MAEKREIAVIVEEIKDVRAKGETLAYSVDELAADIEVVAAEMLVDMVKVTEKGNKSAAKRVRDYTKVLETLGKAFRKESVKM